MAKVNPEDRMKATDRGVTAKMLSKFAFILISVRIVPVSLNKKGNKINTSNFNRKKMLNLTEILLKKNVCVPICIYSTSLVIIVSFYFYLKDRY
jgi:hypothetical protein